MGKALLRVDPAGRRAAVDRGSTKYQFTAAQRDEFIKLSSNVDDEWVADMDKRGFKGAQLLSTAKSLIAKHGRG